MLSNQNPSLYSQHRRTNSTPAIRQVVPTVSIFPANHNQQSEKHRRGLTIDQSTHGQLTRFQPQQDNGPVYTNQGPQAQYTIRETQQHAMARPGQHGLPQLSHVAQNYFDHISPPTSSITHNVDQNTSGTSSYSAHKHHTEQQQRFQLQTVLNHIEQQKQPRFQAISNGANSGVFPDLTNTTSTGYLDGFDDARKRGIEDASKDEMEELKRILGVGDMSEDQLHQQVAASLQRPFTPPSQSNINWFPMTPAATPFTQKSEAQKKSRSRTAQSSPVRRGPTGTIKGPQAQFMKRGSSCQDAFSTTNLRTNNQNIPLPPHTVQLPCSSTFDIAPIPSPSFMSLGTLKTDVIARGTKYDSSNYSPMSNHLSSTLSSFQSSPEMAHMDFFSELGGNAQTRTASEQPLHGTEYSSVPDFGNMSFAAEEEPLSRTQSISELTSEPINGTIVQTGITSEEIASFIQGPDAITNKYTCMYPECQKVFGRKENVKAHVQTHLGDRQFLCKECLKQFVRQHDLKRHAKIHTEEKPYICPCKAEFGREDALTRHRHRNNCCGGIGDTPKKESKRGRPRKNNRPDTAERLEKAARTRQRVLEKKVYASSQSGSSEYSLPSPPQFFEDTNMRDSSPFDTIPEMQPMSYGVPPDLFSYTPPYSPGYSTGMSPQLSQLSHTPKAMASSPSPKRSESITSIIQEDSEELPTAVSPTKSVVSQYGTPPELELLSSSPTALKIFNFDEISEAGSGTIDDLSFQARNILADEDSEDLEFARNLQEYQARFEGAFKTDEEENPLSNDQFQSTWEINDSVTSQSPWDDEVPVF
ncbi:Zinc finger and SCAN domain-containing protein 5B [Lambiella insularis]|nr:Zinc finger and SCAN domain-containing protein 5B [Lambiella insularis]